MDQEVFERSAQANLQQHRDRLAVHENALTATAKALSTPGVPNPPRAHAQLKDILKDVSLAVSESREIVEDHANGTLQVSNGLLFDAARTIEAGDNVLNGIILLEAVRPFAT